MHCICTWVCSGRSTGDFKGSETLYLASLYVSVHRRMSRGLNFQCTSRRGGGRRMETRFSAVPICTRRGYVRWWYVLRGGSSAPCKSVPCPSRLLRKLPGYFVANRIVRLPLLSRWQIVKVKCSTTPSCTLPPYPPSGGILAEHTLHINMKLGGFSPCKHKKPVQPLVTEYMWSLCNILIVHATGVFYAQHWLY